MRSKTAIFEGFFSPKTYFGPKIIFKVENSHFLGKIAYEDDISKYIITTPLKRKNCLWFSCAVRANLSAVEGCQSTTCPRYISFIFSRFHFCLVAWIIYMLLPYKIISPSLKGLVSLGTRPRFGVLGCRFQFNPP